MQFIKNQMKDHTVEYYILIVQILLLGVCLGLLESILFIFSFLTEYFYFKFPEYKNLKNSYRIFNHAIFPFISFKLPLQQNNYDCGLYVYYYLRNFFQYYLKKPKPIFNHEGPNKKELFIPKDIVISSEVNKIRMTLSTELLIEKNKKRKVI